MSEAQTHPQADDRPKPKLWALSLGALGVVYGDIGTSPLYAVRECFDSVHGVAPTRANVLGVLSLITWSLILVVMVKYLWLVMQADNEGEGGILALLALVAKPSSDGHPSRGRGRARAGGPVRRCRCSTATG